MNFKTLSFILILLFFIVGMGCVSASEINDNGTISQDLQISSAEGLYQNELSNFQKNNESNVITSNSQDSLQASENDDVIVVNNWDELQYYCSLKDNDYTLKLKDNTNFYPTKTGDSNYQIKVYNNVKIIGGNGSYIGDKSSNPSTIRYTAIVVPDDYKSSITLENVTFKWISALSAPDGLFIQMGGKYNSVIRNCNFTDIAVDYGHASIVYLKKGTATLENCSFINCTSGYGCVGIYDPDNFKKIKMIVKDCYFEGNYATTAPGCINNCGILEVYNSTFYNNRAFWWAGAIHTHGGGNTTIHDSNFTDNVAGWNGGALYTYSYLQIYNTIFSGNNCTTNNGGGAIGACAYQSNPHIFIEKCLFENNANNCWSLDSLSTTGTGRGGAISFMDEGSIEVHDTTFIANAASIGTAICAWAMGEYGSPNVMITNNSFINHTRYGDTLNIYVSGTVAVVEDNYFYGNSIRFSNLTLTKINEDKDYATLEVSCSLSNPSYYDSDILDKTSYEVYVNGEYVKTVDSKRFTIDFDDLDICDVYVIPTVSNQKSNSVHLVSTREYIFVSKNKGNDNNNGLSRNTPVSSIKKALELAGDCQSIIIMDGEYSEKNLTINYDLLIKGEGNATLVNNTSFTVNANNFTLKNIKVDSIIGESFIKQVKGNLIIDKCIFNDNAVSRLIDADNVNITKSIFTNNDVLIYNNGFTYIRNSILLNNTKIIDNNLDNIDLDYNWWGNTLNNISKPLNLRINNWLILNATSNENALENGQTCIVQFRMYLFENNQVTKYSDLIKFNLEVNASNASVNKDSIDYNGNVVYTQNSLTDSVFTASYNNVEINLLFKFLKSSPNLSIKFSNIRYNDDLIITVSAPKDITGDVSVTVGRETTIKPLTNGVKFTFKYLEAGDYNITVNYNGNEKYLSQVIKDSVNVRKYDSTTKISLGNVKVGEDLKITVETSRGTTGNINLTINNLSEILTLKNVEASYVFKSIPRGDYLITAYYMGDNRNLPSRDQVFIEVDNLNPNLVASVADSNYGEAAVIDVSLDGDAEGYVTATIDDITNSSKVTNGKSKIYLTGAEAGINRNVTIFYSGDNTYLNKTITANMNVFKSNFSFNISSEDIFIGHDAVVTIKVPLRTSGNFTIDDVVLSIPMSGEVSYVIPDLEVGKYTITAVYNGNNYFTVENSTSFEVFEYPAPQWMNDGADIKNTQKTDYVSSSDGNVSWVSQINSTVIANLVIDSEGNLYMATTNGIYSYDCQGNLRWIYQSDGRLGNFSGLAIGRDVIISPRAGDTIYLIRNTLNLVNQTTGEKYGNSNIYQASSLFVPIIDANAFIYTVSEYQFMGNGYNLVITPFKIWEGGGQPILVSLGNTKPIAPPSVNEDMMVVICDGSLMIFDAHTLSANSIKTGNFKNVRPVIGDGNIVYTILGNSIVAYTITGSQYGSKIPITGGSGDKLLIDNELGMLYATNAEGHLYSYDIFTLEETLISNLCITSGILIDGNHNLYFASDNIFYCINSSGEVLWKSNLGSKITSNPIMNKEGVIYLTSTDNKLFALSNVTGDNSTNTTVKVDPVLVVSVDDVSVGDNVVVNVRTSVERGNFTVNIDDTDYPLVVSNGESSLVIENLAAGSYEAVVGFSGDDKFNPVLNSTKFNVLKIKVFVNDETFVIPDGNSTECSISLPVDATGTLTVTVGGRTYTETLSNGKASVNVPELGEGSHNLTVAYSGDAKYESASKTVELNHVKIPVQLDLNIVSPSDVPSVSLQLDRQATGSLSVTVGGNVFSADLANGSAVVNVNGLNPGNHSAVVTYSGDFRFAKAEKTVILEVPKITLDLNDSVFVSKIDEGILVEVSLPSDATGDVNVRVNSNDFKGSLSNGFASIDVTGLNPGNYTASLTYSGDGKYDHALKTFDFEVPKIVLQFNDSNLIISKSADGILVNVTLPVDAGGNIVVSLNGTNYTSSLAEGAASVKVTDLTAGNWQAKVTYAGNEKYESISKTVSFAVDMVEISFNDTTLSIISPSPQPVVNVMFDRDVTGNITVTLNSREFIRQLVNGAASVELTDLGPGNYSATVTYSGDSRYGATERTIIVEVPRITTTLDNMVVKSNVAVPVISVMLPSDAGGNLIVNLTGNVYIAKVVNGNCSIEIAGLTPGNYSAVVSYSGDSNYAGASKAVDLEVPKMIIALNDNNCRWNASQISVSLNNATGTLTVEIANKTFAKELINGSAVIDIGSLDPGSYDVRVIYSGDNVFTGAEKVIKLEIPKLKVVFDDGTLTVNSTNVNVNLPEDATGNVTVVGSGKSFTKELADGKVTVNVVGLAPGSYNATVIYSGDRKYDSASKIVSVNVPKVVPELNNDTLLIDTDNASSSVSIALPDDATGTLTVTVDGRNYTETLTNGKATVSIPEMAPGSHDITVTYSGDEKYSSLSSSRVVEVSKHDCELTVDAGDISVGETAVVNVKVNSKATGNVTITINNKEYSAVIKNGIASVSVDDLVYGNYEVGVKYDGDANFNGASNFTRFNVLKVNVPLTNETISIPDANSTEYAVSLPSDATGTLTVTVDGKTYSETLTDGKATVSIPELDEGSHNITVTYSGDGKYESMSRFVVVNVTGVEDNSTDISVVKVNPALAVGASDINVGDDAIITVKTSVVSGKLTVNVNSRDYEVAISNGESQLSVCDLASGSYVVIARFSGDDEFNAASNSTEFNVLKVVVPITNETINIPEGNSTEYGISLPENATGNLTVTVDGKTYTETLTDGKATVSIPELDEGSHNITVSYSGDGNYEQISKSAVVNVVNNTISEREVVKVVPALIVSASDINVGDDALITVKTSVGSGKLTVNVNSRDYEVSIANGESRLTVSDLDAGNYEAIVRFAGDGEFNEAVGSAKFNVLKVIMPVTNETIIIPEDNSTEYAISLPEDANGTLTVTVDGVSYTKNLSKGKATVSIPKLREGSHNVIVTYSGDEKYETIARSTILKVNATAVKADPVMVVSAGDVTVGDDVVISVKSSVKNANVTVSVNGMDYVLVVGDGEARLSISDLGVGNYTAIVSFAGDDEFNPAANSTVFNVLKVDVSITNETFTPVKADSTEYSISLPSDATGTFTVTVDGKEYSETLSGGKATVTIPALSSGSHNITVAYSGDTKYSAITKTTVVTKEPVIRLTGSNLNMLYTSGKYFKVRLTADGQPLVGKSVKIAINGKTYSRTTDSNGYASLKISLPPKTYAVKASYGNVSVAKKVVVKSVITAKNVNAKRSAKTIKVKVTLKKVNGKYLKNKWVSLKFNKKTFKVKTTKKGVATFTIKNTVFKKLKVNKKYTYQVTYGKDKVKKTIKFKK